MAYAVEEVTDIQDRVITEIQTGRSLRQVCKDDGMPDFRTVQRWIVSDAQFAVKYARARVAQADTLFDRMEEVEEAVSAGTMDSHAARVVLDSMRWRASKLAPKVYGDRLDVSVTDNRISITGALQAAQSRLVDDVIDVPCISMTDAENANENQGGGRAEG
jgi:Asp-tRNA(Asn)/Glu-tRNA(Gln) amidotransferase B subunit